MCIYIYTYHLYNMEVHVQHPQVNLMSWRQQKKKKNGLQLRHVLQAALYLRSQTSHHSSGRVIVLGSIGTNNPNSHPQTRSPPLAMAHVGYHLRTRDGPNSPRCPKKWSLQRLDCWRWCGGRVLHLADRSCGVWIRPVDFRQSRSHPFLGYNKLSIHHIIHINPQHVPNRNQV